MTGCWLESRKCVRHWIETKKDRNVWRQAVQHVLLLSSSVSCCARHVMFFSALEASSRLPRMQQSPCDQKFQMHGLYFTCLLKPLERHSHGSVQRSGSSLYCLGKENTLKNVSGLSDCQLLQRREDKTGRPLVVFYEQESLTVPETFSYKTYCITLLDPSALIGWGFCPHQSDAVWFNSSHEGVSATVVRESEGAVWSSTVCP